MDELRRDITEILIKTWYHAAYGSGDTAKDIVQWEQDAIIKYQTDAKFYAIVDRQVALIMDTFRRWRHKDLGPEEFPGLIVPVNVPDFPKEVIELEELKRKLLENVSELPEI